MSKAIINVKIDSEMKDEAQALASKLGIPLSVVVKNSIKNFIGSQGIELKAFQTPYGLFKKSKVTEKDIQNAKKNWNKAANELLT